MGGIPPIEYENRKASMAVFTPDPRAVEKSRDKGLKTGALGLVSSVVIGVVSTAPARLSS